MAILDSTRFAEFVLPYVRKEWLLALDAIQAEVAPLFMQENSTAATETSQGIGVIGLIPEYNSADAEGEPGSIAAGVFNPLYAETFTHKEYALKLVVQRKLWDDDQQGLIRRQVQQFGDAFGATIASHMSSVFNNAFSSSYTGGDSVALCSASHPYNKNVATTFSNYTTSALSYDAVAVGQAAGLAMVNDKGLSFPVVYSDLVVPPALRQKAIEIVGASGKAGGGDNDANAIAGLNVIVEPRLSDANNWFLVDRRLANRHLLWFWRVRPEVAVDPSGTFNLQAQYRGYMRYSFGWDDPRWIYGANVT